MIQRIKLTEPKIDSAMKISIWEEINKKHTQYKKTDFDYISRVSTGNVYKVKIGHKYNFIHSDYTLVFNTDDQTEWFDSVENFTSEGLCLVKRDDKYNFLSLDGKLLSTISFTSASNFNGDYAIVYGSLEVSKYNDVSVRKTTLQRYRQILIPTNILRKILRVRSKKNTVKLSEILFFTVK